MIRWCSYCNRFMGETEPIRQFSITHGICPACKSHRAALGTTESMHKIREIRDFHASLREMACAGHKVDLYAAVSHGIETLGLKPLDLFIGIIQPILQEIGFLWESGQMTVAREHLFTAFAEELLLELRKSLCSNRSQQRLALGSRGSSRPEVLVTCVPGNFHTLGAKILDLFLLDQGIDSLCVTPGLPLEELLTMIDEYRPNVLALSASQIGQRAAVEKLMSMMPHELERGRPAAVIVGGSCVTADPAAWQGVPGIHLAPRMIDELTLLIRRLLPDTQGLASRAAL